MSQAEYCESHDRIFDANESDFCPECESQYNPGKCLFCGHPKQYFVGMGYFCNNGGCDWFDQFKKQAPEGDQP